MFQNELILKYSRFGAEGVRAFFLLSGFLMCSSTDLSENHWGMYYKKRVLRILPLYFFILAWYFLLAITGVLPWPEDTTGLYWWRYVLFLSTWIPSAESYWTNLGATWTVSFFVLFYFFAPIFFRSLNTWIKCVFAACIAIVLCSRLIPAGWFLPLTGMYAFFWGMAMHHGIHEKKILETIAISGALAILFNVGGFAYPYGDTFAMAAVMMAMLSCETNFRIRFLDGCINFIDRHSYTIYLVHVAVLEAVGLWLPKLHGILWAGLILLISFPLSAGIDKILDLLAKSIFMERKTHEF